MELNLPNIIVMIAAAQGLLLAALILQKHRSLFANRYLAAMMAMYTVVLVHLLLQDTGLYERMPFLFLVSGAPLVALPLHWLYTKHLISRTQRFSSNELTHFVLFLLYEAVLIVSILTGTIDLSQAGTADASVTPPLLRIFNMVVIAQGLFYFLRSIRSIRRYDAHLLDVASSVDRIRLTWLRNITVAGLAAIFLFVTEELFMLDGMNVSNFLLSSVGFAIYVYGLGYGGLLSSGVLSEPAVEKAVAAAETLTGEETDVPSAKYERSGLTAEHAEAIHTALIAIMEKEHAYRNSQLTLTDLSEALNVSPHNLSEVINTRLGKNFYDMVNGYRLQEVKRDLTDPAKANLKILSIAFDAGFNSKATFNTLFKLETGKTPSDYRRGG